MSNTIVPAPYQNHVIPDAGGIFIPNEIMSVSLNRDSALRRLLDTDYDFAKDNGLIDIFQFEPETGKDGLMHVLAGERGTDVHGMTTVEGFHHEPSALHEQTTVDRDHLEDANAKHRRRYVEHPFEPYKARVRVQGFAKHAIKEGEDGMKTSEPIDNNMFPKEYDALAVLQAIGQAYEGREQNDVEPIDGKVVAVGVANMLDGKAKLPIRMVLDAETQKIVTAMALPKESGYMKLSEEAIRNSLGL